MKLIHCQIALAAAVVAAAGAGFAYMNAASELKRARAQIEEAQRAPAPKPSEPRKPSRDFEAELRQANLHAEQLEGANRQLQKTVEDLKARVRDLQARLDAATPGASAQPSVAMAPPAPPPPVVRNPAAPPPPPPDAPPGEEPGTGRPGPAGNAEMRELVEAVKLTPEQAEAARKIIIDGQAEFQQRMIDAGRRGERDVHVIEQIGNEISKELESRIQQLLTPEQQQPFRDYMRSKEQPR
jgi:hypothetical protein